MLNRYRLHTRDGDEVGEAEYTMRIKSGDLIHANDGSELRVLDAVPTEDDSPLYVGLLMLEPV